MLVCSYVLMFLASSFDFVSFYVHIYIYMFFRMWCSFACILCLYMFYCFVLFIYALMFSNCIHMFIGFNAYVLMCVYIYMYI